MPFDWIITPFEAVEMVLDDQGAGLGRKFISVRGGTSTQCATYGVLYEHEFPRDESRQVLFDAEVITECRSRLVHKMETLAEILSSGKRVLFIRAFSSTGLAGDRFNEDTFTSADLNHLVTVIEKNAPDLAFDVLFIRSADRTSEKIDLSGPLASNVIVRDIAQPTDMDWYGIDADWIALFVELGLLKPDDVMPTCQQGSMLECDVDGSPPRDVEPRSEDQDDLRDRTTAMIAGI